MRSSSYCRLVLPCNYKYIPFSTIILHTTKNMKFSKGLALFLLLVFAATAALADESQLGTQGIFIYLSNCPSLITIALYFTDFKTLCLKAMSQKRSTNVAVVTAATGAAAAVGMAAAADDGVAAPPVGLLNLYLPNILFLLRRLPNYRFFDGF